MARSIFFRSYMCTSVFLLMTSISVANGQVTLSSLGNVNIYIPDGNAVYNCGSLSGTITSVQWLINGTLLEDLTLTNAATDFSEIGRQGILIFKNISVESHNNTIIQCRAIFNNGTTVYSNNSILLVQGLLSAVGSLTATLIPLDSIITLTWTPPFSLDIPNVDPDIKYCVGVANSTSSLAIHSECGITDTQYNYTVSPPNDVVCDTYTFTITPVNVVGNGTSANVTRGILPRGSTILQGPGDIKLVPDGVLITFNVSAPVCSGSVSLQDIYDSNYMLGPIEVTPDNQDNSISVMIPENLNQEFNAIFTLINSVGSDTSDIIKISTFDVQDIQDDVVIDYIKNTEALGALLALMYLDQDGNIVCDQSIYAAIRRNETFPMGDPAITTTEYMGLAYDVDQRNGLPKETYPAVRREVDIRNKMPVSSGSSCSVTYVSKTAIISCVDSTSNQYQVILLQQNGSNILTAVNVTSGTQVSLAVPSGRYCVLELPMKDNELMYSEVKYSREFIAEEDDTTQSSTINVLEVVNSPDVIGIIIGVVVLLLCTLLIGLILVVIVATIKIKKKTLKSAKCGSNNYEAPSQLELHSVSVHMEDRLPIYTDVIPVALRQVSVHTNSTNFSDEPLVEAPPPLPPYSLEPTEVPPPLPPSYSPPEEPENYSSVPVVKDNSTSQTTMELRKGKAKDADIVYSDIHTGRGAEMSPLNVFGVKYEEVTGSKNKHGQNYPFVTLPNQTQCYDGDETTVIYSELKTKEATQKDEKMKENSEELKKEPATQRDEEVNEKLATGSGEKMKEGIATGSGEGVEKGVAIGSGEEEDEGLATRSGEEEDEGLATGSGEEEDEGLATGSGKKEDEGLANGSGKKEDEGLANGSSKEEDEGLATGSDEETDEGLATGSDEKVKEVIANQKDGEVETKENNAVEQVTSDIDPVRHITAIMKSSTSFIGVKIFFHGCADVSNSNDTYDSLASDLYDSNEIYNSSDIYDSSDTSDSSCNAQCTEPSDPIVEELYSYAMLKPSVSKMPDQVYTYPGSVKVRKMILIKIMDPGWRDSKYKDKSGTDMCKQLYFAIKNNEKNTNEDCPDPNQYNIIIMNNNGVEEDPTKSGETSPDDGTLICNDDDHCRTETLTDNIGGENDDETVSLKPNQLGEQKLAISPLHRDIPLCEDYTHTMSCLDGGSSSGKETEKEIVTARGKNIEPLVERSNSTNAKAILTYIATTFIKNWPVSIVLLSASGPMFDAARNGSSPNRMHQYPPHLQLLQFLMILVWLLVLLEFVTKLNIPRLIRRKCSVYGNSLAYLPSFYGASVVCPSACSSNPLPNPGELPADDLSQSYDADIELNTAQSVFESEGSVSQNLNSAFVIRENTAQRVKTEMIVVGERLCVLTEEIGDHSNGRPNIKKDIVHNALVIETGVRYACSGTIKSFNATEMIAVGERLLVPAEEIRDHNNGRTNTKRDIQHDPQSPLVFEADGLIDVVVGPDASDGVFISTREYISDDDIEEEEEDK